eukprot:3940325-Rhodomonas_salina.1
MFLGKYRVVYAGASRIRYVSTGHRRAAYAMSYRTSYSRIRYVSTAHRIAPYAMSVPHILQPYAVCQYTSRSSIHYVGTGSHRSIDYVSTARRIPPYVMSLQIA